MTGPDHGIVRIDDGPLPLDDLCRVAHGDRLELGEAARARILRGRAIVDAAIDGDRPIYGLNTGLGHMRNERVGRDALREYQVMTVATHLGAIGEPLPKDVVRAAMAARVNGIARGGSGATLAVAETLIAMLNAGVHPVVPATGSVGASDLGHMAEIADVAIGRGGRAELGGEILAGPDALRRAGIAPLVMEPKDALAMVSANGVSIGHGALVVQRAERLLEAADLVAACSVEVIRGNPSVFEPAIAAAKPVPGQIEAAAHVRALLAGSCVFDEDGPLSVQDPLSFRVVPQVHGAARAVVDFLRSAVETELNAMDDNPLVAVAEGRLLSGGNFHPMLLAIAADGARIALAHVGQLSDRRMNHLWSAVLGDPTILDPSNWEVAVRKLGRLLQRYAAATIYADLRDLAGPASLDIGVLDLGVEDHATNAPGAVARTATALDRLREILAIELLMGRDALGFLADRRPGTGTGAAFERVGAIIDDLGVTASGGEVLAAVLRELDGPLLAAVDAAAGWPSAVATVAARAGGAGEA